MKLVEDALDKDCHATGNEFSEATGIPPTLVFLIQKIDLNNIAEIKIRC